MSLISSDHNPIPPREDNIGSTGLVLKAPSSKEALNISTISSPIPHVEHEVPSHNSPPPSTNPILRPVSAFTPKYEEVSIENIIPNSINRRVSRFESSHSNKRSTSITMANRTRKSGPSVILSSKLADRFDPISADTSKRIVQPTISPAVFPEGYTSRVKRSAGKITIPARISSPKIPVPEFPFPETQIEAPISRASSILSYADEECQDTMPASYSPSIPAIPINETPIETFNRHIEMEQKMVDYSSTDHSNSPNSDHTIKQSPYRLETPPLPNSPSLSNPVMNYHNPRNPTSLAHKGPYRTVGSTRSKPRRSI